MARILSTGLLVTLLLFSGCGKSDQNDTPRFNETLGGGAVGAPTSPGAVDAGILRNPTSYQPAEYEPLEPPEPAIGASDADNPEVQAARDAVAQAVDAAFELDFEMILAAFVPEQVEALSQAEYIDNMIALSDAMREGSQALKAKAATPDLQMLAGMSDMLGKMAEPLKNTIVVSVLDEQNAIAAFDLSRLEIPEDVQSSLAQVMQMLMGMASQMQGGMPGAASAVAPAEAAGGVSPEMPTPEMLTAQLAGVQIPVPLRKTENGWKISIPFKFEERHAELIDELVTAYKDMSLDMNRALAQAETLDMQTYLQMSQPIQMRHMPALMGLIGRANLMVAELTDALGTENAANAATPTGGAEAAVESAEEPEEQPAERGGGRGRFQP